MLSRLKQYFRADGPQEGKARLPVATGDDGERSGLSRDGVVVDAAPLLSGARDKPLDAREAQTLLPIVPHYDYARLSEHVYGDKDRRMPPGWSEFLLASDVSLDKEGYWATAYINRDIHAVVIAERGTADSAGLRAGIWVYFDEPTIQFTLAEEFSRVVRLRIGLHFPDEEFCLSYTGHSLGGVLATCRAVAEQTFAVVFETPGCRGFVEKVMHPFRVEEADVICYLRPPNAINTLKPQVGLLIQLPGPVGDPLQQLPLAPPGERAQRKLAQMLPTPSNIGQSISEGLTNFMGRRLLEQAVPELWEYVGRIEPVIRELFDQTQQVHTIHNIVPIFEQGRAAGLAEPEACDAVYRWPSHPMQFMEFWSVTRSLAEAHPSEAHLRRAYQSLLEQMYVVRKRDNFRLSTAWLDADARGLVQVLRGQHRDEVLRLLSPLDRRVLASCTLEGTGFTTVGLTAFQLKQYLFVLSRRRNVAPVLCRLVHSDVPPRRPGAPEAARPKL